MMSVTLKCRGCSRHKKYKRLADEDLPLSVVAIESSHCDRCDSGDFGSETWFDAAGNEVSQDIYDDNGELFAAAPKREE